MHTTKKWFAVYTRPRWEKKVYRLLQEKEIESYCPLNKVYRKWSDRTKVVEEPLFKSYVFVRISEADKTFVRMVNGIVNFVYWLGKPAIIKEYDIERIKLFLKEHENVEVESLAFSRDDRIIVTAGALMEREGRVLNRTGKKVTIEIESFGYKLVAYVNSSDLKLRPAPAARKRK